MSIEIALSHDVGDLTLEVDLTAPPGTLAFCGQSGAGKTTVVNAVAGLLQPTKGHISVNGTVLLDTSSGIDIPVHRRRVGYVFQEGRLFPHLTVRQNLTYSGRATGLRPDATEFNRVIELLGIQDLLDRRPGRLSGGEKQRVAIGRALLASPRILLMDEPLAALDAARREEILPYLERLRDEAMTPILYVSHTISEVARLADTVALLDRGRVLKSGPVGDVISDPVAMSAFGVHDVGALLSGTVVSRDLADGLTVISAAGGRIFVPGLQLEPGRSVRLRIAAGDILLARDKPLGLSALNILSVSVADIVDLGGGSMAVGLEAGGESLLARITRRSVRELKLEPGTSCFAILKSTQVSHGS